MPDRLGATGSLVTILLVPTVCRFLLTREMQARLDEIVAADAAA